MTETGYSVTKQHYPQFEFDHRYNQLLPIGLLLSVLLGGTGLAYILVNFSPALAYLIVLAIPTGILLVVRPELGLLLVIIFIPLEDFNQFGGSFSVVKLLSLVVFGGAILNFFIFRRHELLVNSVQNWIIILFVLVVVFSGFIAIDPTRSLIQTVKLLRVLSLYVVTINLIRTEKYLRLLIWIFLISGIISALYGIYGFYFDPTLLNADGRLTGTMDDPNQFAVAMAIRLPLLLSLLSLQKKRIQQLFTLLGIGIVVYAVTLTGSRGGLLSIGMVLILFALLQKNRGLWLLLIIVISVVSLSVMPVSMKQRVGLLESSKDLGNSTDRRETYQIYGWQLVQENPLLGVGFDGFAIAYSQSEYRFLQKGNVMRVAHNTYLEIASGTGLIGLTVFLSLFGVSIFTAWKYASYRDKYPYLGHIALGLFAGQGGFFFGILFLSEQYSKTLWLILALVVATQNIINTLEHEHQRLLGYVKEEV